MAEIINRLDPIRQKQTSRDKLNATFVSQKPLTPKVVKMKTKSLSAILFFLLFSPVSLFAQKTINLDERVKEKVNTAVEKLDNTFGLEKAKKSTIEDIFIDFYLGQQKLKDNIQRPASGMAQGLVSQNFQSVRKQNESLINERESRLKKELTQEQYKKWKGEREKTATRTRREKNKTRARTS